MFALFLPFQRVFALTARIVSAQMPAAMRVCEHKHERRLAAALVLQGGANLSAEAESLAGFAKVGTPFPPHPSGACHARTKTNISVAPCDIALYATTKMSLLPFCTCARSIRISPTYGLKNRVRLPAKSRMSDRDL